MQKPIRPIILEPADDQYHHRLHQPGEIVKGTRIPGAGKVVFMFAPPGSKNSDVERDEIWTIVKPARQSLRHRLAADAFRNSTRR